MTTQQALKRYQMMGYGLLVVLVVGFGGWAALASISGAVIAPGQVALESNSNTVQHLEGGIVSEILVTEGDMVGVGDPLIRLDATETRARLGIVRARIDELIAKQARLEAERDGVAEIEFPLEIGYRAQDPVIAKIIAGQSRLFSARQATVAGQRDQLREKIAQFDEEITGLESQQKAKETQATLILSELEDLKGLRAQGLVPVSRILSLQREAAKLEGERGQLVAQIARIRGRITETNLQILQIDQEARTKILDEMRDVQTQLSELVEKRVAAEAQLHRITIVSPQSGYVHQLNVHTVGGVISPGQDLMHIVPQGERLVVEASVEPRDIDQVTVGQPAVARFSAFDQRSTPEIKGAVTRVAADLMQDKNTGRQFYTIRIEFDETQHARLGDNVLVPGMPADVFIATGARTPLNYLLRPFTDQIERAFREG